MKTIQLTKILNFKRTLAAAALALAVLAYATPGRAMPHIVTFDFSAPGDCSASIFDVAAKYSSCTLKAEAKAAKRGVEPNLAACDAKMVRWTKKSEKKCCSDSIGDPEEHEACIDSLDEATVSVGGSAGPGGDDIYQEDPGCSANTGGASDGSGADILASRYILGDLCNDAQDEARSFRDMLDEYDCCVATSGCAVEASWNGAEMCNEMSCKCEDSTWNTADRAYEQCVSSVGGQVIEAPSEVAADPAGM